MKKNYGDPLAGHPKYLKLEDLSNGSFGFVQKARNLVTGEIVAVKFIERGKNITKYVEREVINQSNLSHPHVVGFREVFLTKNHLAIVLEYLPGGNVLEHILNKQGHLSEDEARRIFQQLIVGVDFLHQMHIVNRDIKLENTLLDNSIRPLVKITDFGFCKSASDSDPKSKVGTPGCMAPELLTKRTYCGKKADAWSCGVMLYAMLFATYPFERLCDRDSPTAVREVWHRIQQLDYYFPDSPAVSESCKELIRLILVREPSARLTIAQIQEHPWFKEGLPRGVAAMNERFSKSQPHEMPGYQTIQAIKETIEAARQEEDFSLENASSTSSDSTSSNSLSFRMRNAAFNSDSMARV